MKINLLVRTCGRVALTGPINRKRILAHLSEASTIRNWASLLTMMTSYLIRRTTYLKSLRKSCSGSLKLPLEAISLSHHWGMKKIYAIAATVETKSLTNLDARVPSSWKVVEQSTAIGSSTTSAALTQPSASLPHMKLLTKRTEVTSSTWAKCSQGQRCLDFTSMESWKKPPLPRPLKSLRSLQMRGTSGIQGRQMQSAKQRKQKEFLKRMMKTSKRRGGVARDSQLTTSSRS